MYTQDNGYLKNIARQVMEERETEFRHLKNCKIGFLLSDKAKKSKGKSVYADTEKVNDKYKVLTNLDFIITFYEPNCEGISGRAMAILMLHELKHIGYDIEDGSCSIVPHDLEDFKNIVDDYGTDWIES